MHNMLRHQSLDFDSFSFSTTSHEGQFYGVTSQGRIYDFPKGGALPKHGLGLFSTFPHVSKYRFLCLFYVLLRLNA